MNIGQAAAATGVSAKRMRYYEQIGLLGWPKRSSSGYRVFDRNDLHTLNFILRARRLGFSLPRISALLELSQNQERSSADVKCLVETHLDELRKKITDLQAMTDTLQHLAGRCDGDNRPDCPILHDLERSDS